MTAGSAAGVASRRGLTFSAAALLVALALALLTGAQAARAFTIAPACTSTQQDANGDTLTQQVCARNDALFSPSIENIGIVGTYGITNSAAQEVTSLTSDFTVTLDHGGTSIPVAFAGTRSPHQILVDSQFPPPGTYALTETMETFGTYNGANIDLSTTSTGTMTVDDSAPTGMRVTVTPTGGGHAGDAFVVTATALDSLGHKVKTFNEPTPWWLDGTTQDDMTPQTPNGFVHGVSTTTVHWANPRSRDVLLFAAGPFIHSRPFNVLGPLDHFGVSAPAHATAGSPSTVTVKALDALGDWITDYAGPTPALTDDTGTTTATFGSWSRGKIHATDATIAQATHADHLTATSGPTTGVSKAFNVLGPLDHFVVTVSGGPKTAGSDFGVTATAIDTVGDVLTTYAGSPSFTDDAGLLTGTPAPFVHGVSTSAAEQLSAPARHDDIHVADGPATGASAPFDVK